MANVFIEEVCLFVTLLAVFTCFLPSCSLLALGRFHHHMDTVRGLKIDIYKTSLKATELICMMAVIWWAVAKEHLAVTFVAASAKNREQHFTPPCGPEEKKSSCFQRRFNFNPDTLLAFAHFCHPFCYHRQIQDVALKCSSGASEAAAAGPPQPLPFFPSTIPFYLVLFNWLAVWQRSSAREWGMERGGKYVPRCGRQLWEGCDEKIMMLVTFYYTKCGI